MVGLLKTPSSIADNWVHRNETRDFGLLSDNIPDELENQLHRITFMVDQTVIHFTSGLNAMSAIIMKMRDKVHPSPKSLLLPQNRLLIDSDKYALVGTRQQINDCYLRF